MKVTSEFGIESVSCDKMEDCLDFPKLCSGCQRNGAKKREKRSYFIPIRD